MLQSGFLDRLTTNYAPSEDEVYLLKALISERKVAVDTLNEEIKTLTDTKAEYERFIDEHTALLSPIRRLPTDIFSSIFIACVDHPLVTSRWPVMSNQHPAVVVSHVCRDWGRLSLGLPLLWNIIDIITPNYPGFHQSGITTPLPTSPSSEVMEVHNLHLAAWKVKAERSVDIASTWLTRSGDCPLTFVNEPPYWEEPATSLKNLDEFLGRLVDLFCKSSARWQMADLSLSISGRQLSWQPSPLLRIQSLNPEEVSQLETLVFHIMRFGSNEEGAKNKKFDVPKILTAKGLSSLALPHDVLGPLLRNKSSFGAIHWSAVTHLTIGRGGDLYNMHRFTGREALSLLQCCPWLVSCFMQFPSPRPQRDGESDTSTSTLGVLKHCPGLVILPSLTSLYCESGAERQ